MHPRYTVVLAGQITEADTNVHQLALAGIESGRITFTTPSGNSGTVTIADGVSSGGIVLGAGVGVTIPPVSLGPLLHLNILSYQFSHASDVLNYLIES